MCLYMLLHTKPFFKILYIFEGQCSCGKGAVGTTVYVKPDKSQALASWLEPGFQCATGADATVEETIVNPPVTSPSYFSGGRNVIDYTYKLKGDVTVTCPFTINAVGELKTTLNYRPLPNSD